MLKGTVAWYNDKKGYGFIALEGGKGDIFVHISQFEKIGIDKPCEGMCFEFTTYNDRGRIAACKLKLVSK